MPRLSGAFGEFKGIEETAFQVIGFELDRAVVDRGEAVMMSPLHMDAEPGPLGCC